MKIRIRMQDCSAALAKSVVAAALIGSTLLAGTASAGQLYFNGFETDIAGWTTPTRVASGTDGIVSSSGAYHATSAAGSGDFTRWGGYNYGAGNNVPTAFKEYRTSLDIYLDVGGGAASGTRFDWDSAISNAAGGFQRDFIFNGGFYNDTDGSPGSGTARFIFAAGNNSQPTSAYPKDPGHDPFAISTTGWYTFEHHFYDNGGVLAVEMSISDATDALLKSWTLSTPTDLIGTIGGNRYGWLDFNEFSSLAIDNSELTVVDAAVPEPATLALFGLGFAGLAMRRRKAA